MTPGNSHGIVCAVWRDCGGAMERAATIWLTVRGYAKQLS
jgi:hypothetical protein